MRETSILTYEDLKEQGKISKGQEEVIYALEHLEQATDTEITDFLGYNDPNHIRPRRKELFDMGVVIENSKRICKKTDRLCYVWSLNTGDINKAEVFKSLKNIEMKKVYELINRANEFQFNFRLRSLLPLGGR